MPQNIVRAREHRGIPQSQHARTAYHEAEREHHDEGYAFFEGDLHLCELCGGPEEDEEVADEVEGAGGPEEG